MIPKKDTCLARSLPQAKAEPGNPYVTCLSIHTAWAATTCHTVIYGFVSNNLLNKYGLHTAKYGHRPEQKLTIRGNTIQIRVLSEKKTKKQNRQKHTWLCGFPGGQASVPSFRFSCLDAHKKNKQKKKKKKKKTATTACTPPSVPWLPITISFCARHAQLPGEWRCSCLFRAAASLEFK